MLLIHRVYLNNLTSIRVTLYNGLFPKTDYALSFTTNRISRAFNDTSKLLGIKYYRSDELVTNSDISSDFTVRIQYI